jgi:hypothetical protein
MHFRKGKTALSLFTTIARSARRGMSRAQELRIESFFPMDDATAKVLRGWAAKPKVRARGS